MGFLVAELGETLLTSNANSVLDDAQASESQLFSPAPQASVLPAVVRNADGTSPAGTGGNRVSTPDVPGGSGITEETSTTTDETKGDVLTDDCIGNCGTLLDPQAPGSNTAVVIVGDQELTVVPLPASAGFLVAAIAALGGAAHGRKRRNADWPHS